MHAYLHCLSHTPLVGFVDPEQAVLDEVNGVIADARRRIEAFLATLRLTIHPIKSQLFETRHGANFLGFRVFPDRIRVRSENLRRARRRWRQQQADYAARRLTQQELTQSLRSWIAHVAHGSAWRLREQMFARLAFARG